MSVFVDFHKKTRTDFHEKIFKNNKTLNWPCWAFRLWFIEWIYCSGSLLKDDSLVSTSLSVDCDVVSDSIDEL